MDHLKRLVYHNKYDASQLSDEKKYFRSKKLQDFLEKHAKLRVPSDSEEDEPEMEGGEKNNGEKGNVYKPKIKFINNAESE